MYTPAFTSMIDYCRDVVPTILIRDWATEASFASQIGEDILVRATAFADMPRRDQDVLIAPFVEEVFDHRPHGSPLDLKAKVTVVVRNGLLAQAHRDGLPDSAIIAATERAAMPLSTFLSAPPTGRSPHPVENPFSDLPVRYPRAWACLNALADAFADGGRVSLNLPNGPTPEFLTEITGGEQDLAELLNQAPSGDGDVVVYVSALSRYSRDSERLHQILEYLLARDTTVLTTNYLIRPTEVWVRRRALIKPDKKDPYAGIRQSHGLTGVHRKIAA